MAKAYKVEVIGKDGRKVSHTVEVGGGNMTAEQVQAQYDAWAARGGALHPFPGAKSWRVLPETETDIGDRTGREATPPEVPHAAETLGAE